jgi:hypothetical protein
MCIVGMHQWLFYGPSAGRLPVYVPLLDSISWYMPPAGLSASTGGVMMWPRWELRGHIMLWQWHTFE